VNAIDDLTYGTLYSTRTHRARTLAPGAYRPTDVRMALKKASLVPKLVKVDKSG